MVADVGFVSRLIHKKGLCGRVQLVHHAGSLKSVSRGADVGCFCFQAAGVGVVFYGRVGTQ